MPADAARPPGAGDPDPVAARALRLLQARGETLAVAESLTGGLLGAALTSVPGSSAVVRGGVIAYATDLKASLLGVPEHLLAEHGAVDPDVAAAMADGVRRRCAAGWGVALTGVAGPDPQDDRPPGTVYVAIVGPSDAARAACGGPAPSAASAGSARVLRLDLPGDRAAVRAGAVRAALDALVVSVAKAGSGPA